MNKRICRVIVFLMVSLLFSNRAMSAQGLKEALLLPLPLQWSTFSQYIGGTSAKIMGGGPSAFAIDVNQSIYIEDNNQNVVQLNRKGQLRKTFVNPYPKNKFSDLLLSGSKLFVGYQDRPNVVIFDTKSSKVAKLVGFLEDKSVTLV